LLSGLFCEKFQRFYFFGAALAIIAQVGIMLVNHAFESQNSIGGD
jgi:hypothetical protein